MPRNLAKLGDFLFKRLVQLVTCVTLTGGGGGDANATPLGRIRDVVYSLVEADFSRVRHSSVWRSAEAKSFALT